MYGAAPTGYTYCFSEDSYRSINILNLYYSVKQSTRRDTTKNNRNDVTYGKLTGRFGEGFYKDHSKGRSHGMEHMWKQHMMQG